MKEKILKFEVPGKEYELTLIRKKPVKLKETHYVYSKNPTIVTEDSPKFCDELVNAALEIKAYDEKVFDRLIKEVKYEYAIMLMGERFTSVDRPDNNSSVVRVLYVNANGEIRKVLAILFQEEPYSFTPRVEYEIALSPGEKDFDTYVKLFIKSYYDSFKGDKSQFVEFTNKLSNGVLNKYFDIRFVPKK